ncbi:MAG: integration host factor subunit beta [Deltaproteobacteria bacterium]|nr:integration host factor subunit beta [Deltaproteobacteria bacterium]
MNKSDLIAKLAKDADISHNKAQATVDIIFDEMFKSLVGNERIEIRGFGSFIIKKYDSYVGRNPKTKESITVPVKRLPYFKVGKELKARVDAMEDAAGGGGEPMPAASPIAATQERPAPPAAPWTPDDES